MDKKVREELRHEEAKKILDSMNEEYNIGKVQEMIKDNQIEFTYEEKEYRVRLLTAKEKDELDYLRRKKYGQLIQDRDILLEKDLIVVYKERGLDISELDVEIKKISKQIAELNYKLGASLANKSGDTVLKTYEEDIKKLTAQLYEIMIKKNHLLEYSLENQLNNYVAKITSYLSLDIKIEDKWIRAFNSLDDYMNTSDKLINLAGTYSMALQYHI